MYNKSCEELPGPGQAQGLRSIVGQSWDTGWDLVGFREDGTFVETLKSASTAGDLQTIARFSHSDDCLLCFSESWVQAP